MALDDYRQCMAQGLKGKTGLSKQERQLVFCTQSKICSSKASSREEAEEICLQPKTAKPVKVQEQEALPVKVTPSVKPVVEVSPMGDWLAGNKEDECRACLLPPVIQWYREELEENNHPELVKDVDEAVHSGDPALMAWTFDAVKGKVSDKVKQRLREFDYNVQNYKGEK